MTFGQSSSIPSPAPRRAALGAIRWDAWFGPRDAVGRAVEASLAPAQWRDRLPFFAELLPDGVRLDGSSQEIIDREIGYAVAAGLDYWAFVLYPPESPLSLGLERYLASRRRGDLRFCAVTECGRWHDPAFAARVAALVQERGYQTVLDGRALVYLGFVTEQALGGFDSGLKGVRKVLDRFQDALAGAGSPRAYLVLMDPNPQTAKAHAEALGCDAISSYAVGWYQGSIEYPEFAATVERHWDDCRATGMPTVPIAMTGWDRRPRVENPVPWETWQEPGKGLAHYVQAGTPAQIAAHVGRAVAWIDAHPDAAPARTALVYAWNEFDEGGWLAPTLAEGDARLRALRDVLEPHGSASRPAASLPRH